MQSRLKTKQDPEETRNGGDGRFRDQQGQSPPSPSSLCLVPDRAIARSESGWPGRGRHVELF